MSDTIIKVENLSKSYMIRHQQAERYTALRDVLANGAGAVLGMTRTEIRRKFDEIVDFLFEFN
jgi:lipopolysaccharide transport system ATP-binding protein